MKKISHILIITVIIATLINISCKNAPIFAAIEQEIKLKKASVKGSVRGITKIGTTVYVSNGNLYKKSLGNTGSWNQMCSRDCGSLATDGTKLYAVFGNNLQVYDGGWKSVNVGGLGFVAGTNTVFATDRKKIFTVSGTTATATTIDGELKGAAGIYCVTTKGVYKADGTKVAGSGAPDSGSAICKGEGSGIFVLSGGTLYAYDGSNWTSKTHGVSTSSASSTITYLPNKHLVLISGSSGYGEIRVDNTTPMDLEKAENISVGSGGSSVPSGCYQQYKNSAGKWLLDPIAAYENGSGYIVYAGVHDSKAKYTGLWGFYNPGQREWNRE